MKNCFIQIILFSFLCVCTSCKNKESKIEFSAKPIVKTVGKIDVMVDPNVEMMMILGRLSGASPFNFVNNLLKSPYIDDVDSYFLPYKQELAVSMTRKTNMSYNSIPEFGMYMNKNNSGFVMDVNNENFVVLPNNQPAKKIYYYAGKDYINEIRNFREKSNFDTFFINNIQFYENQIYLIEQTLSKYEFSNWLEDFYGKKLKRNIKLHVTSLTGGGNFGLSIKDSKGRETLNSEIAEFRNEESFLHLISHEFSHPRTITVAEKLYMNEEIRAIFGRHFAANHSTYIQNGYQNAFNIFIETINQACANKFWEKILSEKQKNILNNEINNVLKLTYVPQIAEFLDNYQNNRDKYKTLEDFIPELEEFILTLE